jgi:hypothetical protein
VLETIVDNGAIESRRDDKVRSGFPRLLRLPDVQHRAHSSKHFRLLLRDAPQRIKSGGSAKRDLRYRQSAREQCGSKGHRVLRFVDNDHWNDAPAPERFRHHRLLNVH